MNNHKITRRKLEWARKVYVQNEPRDIFYRAATALIKLATGPDSPLNLAEALAVLLQTCNKAYYQFRPFDRKHFADLENILAKHQAALSAVRNRSIEAFAEQDKDTVKETFSEFEQLLGPVGAAKCLHVLAPGFFPLWDRSIADAYGLALWPRGQNADRYCEFMTITRKQVKSLGGKQGIGRNPLKAIDEYNYVKARGWKLHKSVPE